MHDRTTGTPFTPSFNMSGRESFAPTQMIPARRIVVVVNFSPGDTDFGRFKVLFKARPRMIETGIPDRGTAVRDVIVEAARKPAVETDAASATPGIGEGGEEDNRR